MRWILNLYVLGIGLGSEGTVLKGRKNFSFYGSRLCSLKQKTIRKKHTNLFNKVLTWYRSLHEEMKTQSSVKPEPFFLLALMESKKVWEVWQAKGCEFRVINRGNLSRHVCSHSSWRSSLLGTGSPSPRYGEGTSHEALMTCFRRRSEPFLHIPLLKWFQPKILNMPRCCILGELVLNPINIRVKS